MNVHFMSRYVHVLIYVPISRHVYIYMCLDMSRYTWPRDWFNETSGYSSNIQWRLKIFFLLQNTYV
jgi:hypothetical protein